MRLSLEALRPHYSLVKPFFLSSFNIPHAFLKDVHHLRRNDRRAYEVFPSLIPSFSPNELSARYEWAEDYYIVLPTPSSIMTGALGKKREVRWRLFFFISSCRTELWTAMNESLIASIFLFLYFYFLIITKSYAGKLRSFMGARGSSQEC